METIERLFRDLETKSPQRFSSEQIQTFTSNLTESLGSGGFGDVYKGILPNGMRVAVKVLNSGLLSDGIKDQFKAEVSVLGNTHHRNLVKLWGFCFEDNMKAIVYEFMENESLDKLLYGNQKIEWETLCNIVTGTANGLSYLHRDCEPRIIHYDIKPSNILLDSKFSPKVGDFGLAKLLNQDKSYITESRFRGTPVYVAPELTMPYSSITHKCDVYSYGITLFDIIGRRRHLIGEGQKWFPSHVWKEFEKQQHEELMRECGIQKKHREQAKRMLLIALLCVQFQPEHRPSMSHVVRLLEGREEIELPPYPFLYLESSSRTQIESSTSKIEGEEARGIAKRRLERERGWREAMSDMSEDQSEEETEEEKGGISADDNSIRGEMQTSSVNVMDSLFKERKIYIVLISLHGLLCGQNMELGRDSDTRGRVKYVVELARALGMMPGVYRVDLLTRQIVAPDVHWIYGEPTELLTPLGSEDFMHEGESSGSYIVRIPFGPKDKYVRKELLWPHIPEFVDGALSHIIRMSEVLGEQVGAGQPIWPVAIHGHFADAGDSAALLSGALNVPMVFTGHSLGRDKLAQLLKQGHHSREEINSMYKIMRRIEAEELSIDSSDVIITSTREEIEEQWSLYDGFDFTLGRKLQARIRRNVSCYGRFMPLMVVIPPGRELHRIVPHDGETEINEDNPASPDPLIWSEIMRFFTNARKPMILAIARPDPKMNITTLIKAFGECKPLRNLANLTLIMGNREVIDEMSHTNASIILSILKLIDRYDLYGQVAYPKHHKQSDVPSIYRLAAKTKGVFINPAFNEPFGLNLLEAATHGLPMVATENGDPIDIHRVLDNGFLVDPHDKLAIADALLKLVADKQLWAKCRQNALKNLYRFSWPEHCKTYLSRIAKCKQRQPQWKRNDEYENSDSAGHSLSDIQDISLNLQISMDGDKNEGSGSPDEDAGITSKLENAVLSWSKGIVTDARTPGSGEIEDQKRFHSLGRRKHIFVIAVDCDSVSEFVEIIKMVFDAVGKDKISGSTGFILSTFMTISEINSVLVSGGFSATDFDAFICNSGGELYYPSSNFKEMLSPSGLPVVVDFSYHSHIEYCWGGEGLRKTLVRWAASINGNKAENEETIVTEDEQRSTKYCYAFKVNNPSLIPHVKELRKIMRIQALRCHVIYCQNGNKLHAIPVLASRAQALRYLYIQWGADLSNMVVFTGESGDSDYEGLLGGVHKSVVLKGIYCNAGTSQPKSSMSYSLVDAVPYDSPNIVWTANECSTDVICAALRKLDVIKA